MSLRTPLELGFARYLASYYETIFADTPGVEEFVRRGLERAIVWAPGRMIDQCELMLEQWRKVAAEDGPGLSSFLPVIIVSIAKDFTPVPPDWGLSVGTPVDVVVDGDKYGRMYKARMSYNEYRGQAVIFAAEGQTAHSLAMQLHLYANGPHGRRFKHMHEVAGTTAEFPAVLEQIDLAGGLNPLEQRNITGLVFDLMIRAAMPIFQAPKEGEPNDGQPAPAGYPVVREVDVFRRREHAGVAVTVEGVNPIVRDDV
ncbi:hypothetical protein [Paraburkholderia sp. J10-1]|uniref:hypothetical protein n=1 Tax=Paraburkholderia sp. J10-1 TaxID=2805430 RepID=UPI002AB7C781|nr:hypothetical protein [Paraburkholderia sp. J10-1]